MKGIANRANRSSAEILLRLEELEAILSLPAQQRDLRKVEALTMYIARSTSNGRIANLAMQALSAVCGSRDVRNSSADRTIPVVLSALSTAIRAGNPDDRRRTETPAIAEHL